MLDNDVARQFWQWDFNTYGKADLNPPQHKLGKFFLSETVRLMFSQRHSAFSIRQIMDERKILLVNLSTLGDEVRDVLGCFILALVHSAALTRSEMTVAERNQFHVYCDEAHRFMTEALENMIAEARKFGVSLTLAHQYLSQFAERKADALASVGATIIFNVNTKDAHRLVKDLRGQVDVETLIALERGQAIVRAGTEICRIRTLPPPPRPENSPRDAIITESHRRYYRLASEVRDELRYGQRGPRHSVLPVSDTANEEEFIFDDGF